MLEVVGEDLDELVAAGGQLLHPVAEATRGSATRRPRGSLP